MISSYWLQRQGQFDNISILLTPLIFFSLKIVLLFAKLATLVKKTTTMALTLTTAMTMPVIIIQRQVGEAGLGPRVLPSPAPGVIVIEVDRQIITSWCVFLSLGCS